MLSKATLDLHGNYLRQWGVTAPAEALPSQNPVRVFLHVYIRLPTDIYILHIRACIYLLYIYPLYLLSRVQTLAYSAVLSDILIRGWGLVNHLGQAIDKYRFTTIPQRSISLNQSHARTDNSSTTIAADRPIDIAVCACKF